MPISGGECSFTRFGFRDLFTGSNGACLDIGTLLYLLNFHHILSVFICFTFFSSNLFVFLKFLHIYSSARYCRLWRNFRVPKDLCSSFYIWCYRNSTCLGICSWFSCWFTCGCCSSFKSVYSKPNLFRK